jgi:hypothetical protein
MPLISRILFPAFSCFGPLFMVIGLQSPNRSPLNNALALGGALMLTGALLILFFAALGSSTNKSKSNQV